MFSYDAVFLKTNKRDECDDEDDDEIEITQEVAKQSKGAKRSSSRH